ncbi:MAG: DUF11 domain-containing protein [Candidatus Nomurabacteria bacterium]|jgi:uncharacterized repeat protein (TIGR01451 family)|nr:DUF11 domain-containing protein [Candidatus Nomurabacteria bacterium]
MKQVIAAVRRAPKRFIALVAVLAAVIVPAAIGAWGPSDRPTFTIEKPADYVTFNSITNNPKYGDERNFAHIKESGAADSTYTNKINLKAGQEYTVFVYYHNNADASLNASGKGVAHGAYIKAELPAVVNKGATNAGSNIFIGASNANPTQVFDNIYFANSTGADITLRYVQGSAVLTNFKSDTDNTLRSFNLPDSIVGGGAAIGFDSMNGDLPGCNRYSGYVTFKIKAVQPNFSVQKDVRKGGTTSGGWVDNMTANPGDEIEYLITYKNTGSVNQENVVVSDTLPSGVTYVAGSTKLSNGNGANQVMPDGVTTKGLNIGNYAPGAVAYVWFKAKIDAADKLECGKNLSLINTGRVDTPNGANTDTATVTVKTPDCPQVPVYTCDALGIKKITRTKFEFNNQYTAKDGAEYVKTTYTVKDKNGKVVQESTKNTFETTTTGDYTVVAVVTVKVNGQEKTATGKACESNFTVVPDGKPTCEIPGKEYLPPDDPNCKNDPPVTPPVTPGGPGTPSDLPTTGPGEVVSVIVGAGALTTATWYYVASRRQIV